MSFCRICETSEQRRHMERFGRFQNSSVRKLLHTGHRMGFTFSCWRQTVQFQVNGILCCPYIWFRPNFCNVLRCFVLCLFIYVIVSFRWHRSVHGVFAIFLVIFSIEQPPCGLCLNFFATMNLLCHFLHWAAILRNSFDFSVNDDIAVSGCRCRYEWYQFFQFSSFYRSSVVGNDINFSNFLFSFSGPAE